MCKIEKIRLVLHSSWNSNEIHIREEMEKHFEQKAFCSYESKNTASFERPFVPHFSFFRPPQDQEKVCLME